MKYNLIGVSGKIGSGKDLIGSIIQDLTGNKYQIKKFADKLKQRIAFTWNIDKNKLEDQDFKNTLFPELGITWRELMQLEGSKMREIDEDYWMKALFANYRRITKNVPTNGMRTSMIQANYPKWAVTDVRFPNEADTIIDKGGIVIRVERETDNVSNHESETALDNYDKFYTTIQNNGTIEQLIKKIKDLDIV